jgi:hypothetical protein
LEAFLHTRGKHDGQGPRFKVVTRFAVPPPPPVPPRHHAGGDLTLAPQRK